MLFALILGCVSENPVYECDLWPSSSCCTSDDQCAEIYSDPGAENWPICTMADRPEGGLCTACEVAEDCAPTEHHAYFTCEVDENGAGTCVPDARCGTPEAEPACDGLPR